MIDDEHSNFRETSAKHIFQQLDMLWVGIVDEGDDFRAVLLERRDSLYGRHEVGGRLVGKRHHGHISDVGRFQNAALDKATEINDERVTFVARGYGLERLSRFEGDNAARRERRFVDVGGAVVEVVGDEDAAAMLGVADGVGRLTLPSFDRVEEHGHSAIVIG